MTRRFFVTGTNTEVGKTVVSRALVRAYAARGYRVRALKPVESGAKREEGVLIPQDARALHAAAGGRDALDEISAYCFASPVSPHLAAAREQKKIEREPILAMMEEERHGDVDLVVLEGAGGLLVPLSPQLLLADVLAESGVPILIVAPDVLGTINAVLLTLEVASRRNIQVLGVILNRCRGVDLDNAGAIRHHGKVPILGCFEELPGESLDDDDALARHAEKVVDLDRLILAGD